METFFAVGSTLSTLCSLPLLSPPLLSSSALLLCSPPLLSPPHPLLSSSALCIRSHHAHASLDSRSRAASSSSSSSSPAARSDGINVERESAKQVTSRLAAAKKAGTPVEVTFKDTLAFNAKLSDVSMRASNHSHPCPCLLVTDHSSRPGGRWQARLDKTVSTTIAPATATSEAQVLAVNRLEVPEGCKRNAQNGDLLEIRYTGRLADGTVFDGMQLAERFSDDTIQFVLGRQPAGQFPPSWDVGLTGMCVGERREIDVPPALGFGEKGLPKRNVPPNARLLYDVECVAINALSTP